MPLPTLPTPPSRDDPVNFAARADAFLAALPAWADAANALEQSLQLTATTGTSTTSLAVGTGSKTLTTQAGKAWAVGSFVYVVSAASVANLMIGQVTSYNSTTGALTFNVTGSSGSGTIANWVIGLSGGIASAMTFVTSVTTAALYIDATFYSTISSSKPIIAFDTTDYLAYDRSNDRLDLYIGGTSRQYWSGTDGPARPNDATTNDGLVRKSQLDAATAQATTTARGTVELATSAEVAAGTDAQLAVTPATMQASKIVQATAVATTSGVSFDFTGIPSWAKRITICFDQVSTNNTNPVQVQIGSGSVDTSSYQSVCSYSGTGITSTSAFLVGGVNSTDARSGSMVLTNMGSNKWVATSNTTSGNIVFVSGGVHQCGSALDRVRITTTVGTDAFDGGNINITWE